MRVIHKRENFKDAFNTCRNEAGAAFGNSDVYIEKFIVDPRHIEIQILGDQHGNVVHMGERECSLQRRHQKILEEAPSPVITPEVREKMGQAAVNAGKAITWEGVGTVDSIVEKDRTCNFRGTKTGIQVEHRVTEGITFCTTVREQLAAAAGGKIRTGPAKLGAMPLN